MILFKPEMAEKILTGEKTVTRRRWKRPRVKVGSIHQCYTRPAFARPPGKPFTKIRILDIRHELMPAYDWNGLPELSDMEAKREGFENWEAFARAWTAMHGKKSENEPCYRVKFEVVEAQV